MVELIVLGMVALGSGVAWYMRRKGKDESASDIELFRDALKLLARGLLERGEDRAVDFVMSRLTTARVRQLARALGSNRADSDAGARVVRIWLQGRLLVLLGKLKG